MQILVAARGACRSRPTVDLEQRMIPCSASTIREDRRRCSLPRLRNSDATQVPEL
jgi:hypothetical protein